MGLGEIFGIIGMTFGMFGCFLGLQATSEVSKVEKRVAELEAESSSE